MPEPAAFMCYVRFNDQHDDGWLTRFRARLNAEVRAQTGHDFAIFQDRNDISWGQNWQQRIDKALDTVTLLLVIITPSLFRSAPCRAEVEKFLERERALDREDLILPVYYIGSPEMDDPGLRETDDIAKVLASRQLADWRELRLKPMTSPPVRKAIVQLASQMKNTLWQPHAGSEGQAGGTDRGTQRTELPTQISRNQLELDERFVLRLAVTDSERVHLENLHVGSNLDYERNPSVQAELRHLRGLGLIRAKRYIGEMPEHFNLSEWVELTDQGNEYLRRMARTELPTQISRNQLELDERFVLRLAVTDSERVHLENLHVGSNLDYERNPSVQAELRHLRGLGLIRAKRYIGEMPEHFNLSEWVELTDQGNEYLRRTSEQD